MTVPVEKLEAEEFHRGYGEGLAWAREYATPEEVSAYVEAAEGGSSHDRGFIAGCEEVLLDG